MQLCVDGMRVARLLQFALGRGRDKATPGGCGHETSSESGWCGGNADAGVGGVIKLCHRWPQLDPFRQNPAVSS
jgi:hypothetical protein